MLILLLGLSLGACATSSPDPTATSVTASPRTTSSTSGVPSTESPEAAATPVDEPASTQNADLSAASLDYARRLGGVPRQGETLFLVVGAQAATEAEAVALLEQAKPYFGDMVSYFIVQKSDNFEGLAPGEWVVIEAHGENPPEEEVDFGKRGFPHAYVARVTVMTADPIPVYEDRLGL